MRRVWPRRSVPSRSSPYLHSHFRCSVKSRSMTFWEKPGRTRITCQTDTRLFLIHRTTTTGLHRVGPRTFYRHS